VSTDVGHKSVATLTDDKLVGAGEPVVIGAAWSTCSSGMRASVVSCGVFDTPTGARSVWGG